eukprot:6669299-Prymnesium_polylepis.1
MKHLVRVVDAQLREAIAAAEVLEPKEFDQPDGRGRRHVRRELLVEVIDGPGEGERVDVHAEGVADDARGEGRAGQRVHLHSAAAHAALTQGVAQQPRRHLEQALACLKRRRVLDLGRVRRLARVRDGHSWIARLVGRRFE